MDKAAVPSKEMVKKLLHVNGLQKRFDKLMRDYSVLVALPYLVELKIKGDYQSLAAKYYKPESIVDAFHKIYAKHFTGDEMLDLIAFLKTPAGHKYIESAEVISAEMVDVSTEMAIEIAVAMIRDNAPAE
jgi:hypothetical protein